MSNGWQMPWQVPSAVILLGFASAMRPPSWPRSPWPTSSTRRSACC
ncbi:hypothetical protein [Nocardioides eburneiflavus]|nr:hypothetical protein [Nocardioides eburneiflavus]